MAETLPPAFDTWLAARAPGLAPAGVRVALELLDRGATPLFIAHYRRDETGGLDAAAVRHARELGELFAKVRTRQAIILESIERHATLTPALRARVLETFDPDALEDLYHPYRQQKKNRALAAREAGLEPLADWIWGCGHGSETPQEGQTLELWAFTFRNEEKGLKDAKSAIEGARDILVERIAGAPELRALVRRSYFADGFVHAQKSAKVKPQSRFESYFAFHQKVSELREPQHAQRYLALRRGLAEDELQLAIGGGPQDGEFETRLLAAFEAFACSVPESPGAEVLRHAARIAFKNDVRTAIENEVHRTLGEAAHDAAAASFAASVKHRLLAPPFGAKPVVGVDPGPRACRLAALDGSGGFVASLLVELASDEQKAAAGATLLEFAAAHGACALAIGDGASGRELQLMARAGLRAAGRAELPVELVSEAGASAWAASEAARAELPDLEPELRAACSIARRLQDPLAELVRLEPKALGAGAHHHHHDVPHALLQRAAAAAIEDAVASVGVDLNSAPRALLARVPGLQAVAAAVVEHRKARGPFATRRALAAVDGVGEAELAQAAGFLRVRGGEHPLDGTAVHPERYPALEALATRHGKGVGDLLGVGSALVRESGELDAELGPLTRADLVAALECGGRDPRPPFAPFAFRDDVRSLEDLRPGMVCPGLVTNVASFGVFVDVGARLDGLVHVSQLDPARAREGSALQPGDRVEVRVLKVDKLKKQVSLSMKPPRPERRPAARRPRERPASARPRPPAEATATVPGGAARGGRRPPGEPAEAKPAARPPLSRKDQARRPAARRDAGPRPEPRPRPAFNNPFAVLAGLKKSDKGS